MQYIDQQVIDKPAVRVVEHVLEHQTDDDPRGDDRQIKPDAEDPLPALEIVDKVREQHTEQQNERHRHQSI